MGYVDSLEDPPATIIGGMTLNHMKVGVQHFGELSDTIASMALHDGSRNRRIDAVLNNYKETSIKAAERARRGKAITSIHPEKYQVGEIFTGGIKKITWQKLKLNVNKYLWKSRADKSNRQTFWEKFIHTGQREKYFSKNNSKTSQNL